MTLYLWLAFGGSAPLKPKGYRYEVRVHEGVPAPRAGVRAGGGRDDRQGHQPRHRPAHEPDDRHDRDRGQVRAGQARRARDPAHEVGRRRDLRGDPARQPGRARAARRRAAGRPTQVDEIQTIEDVFQIFDPKTRNRFRDVAGVARHRGRRARTRGQRSRSARCRRSRATRRRRSRCSTQERAPLARLVRDSASGLRRAVGRRGRAPGHGHLLRHDAQRDRAPGRRARRDGRADAVVPARVAGDAARPGRLLRRRGPRGRGAAPRARPAAARATPGAPARARPAHAVQPPGRRLRRGPPRACRRSRRRLGGTRRLFAELGPFLEQLNPILQWLEQNQSTTSDFFSNGITALSSSSRVAGTPGGGRPLPAPDRPGRRRGRRRPPRAAPDQPRQRLPVPARQRDLAEASRSQPSFDCRNAGGERKAGPDGPPCNEQAPLFFQNKQQGRFTHVEPDDYRKP